MRFQPETSRPDPIAAAVSMVFEDPDGDLTRPDREMMAWTEGLLTAAAVGPERTRPDEWARAVFGPGHKFEDAEQAQASMAMLSLMYNAILGDLRRKGPEYVPLFFRHAEQGEGVELGTHWAAGFVAGTQLRSEAWESLMVSQQGKLSVAVIIALLTDGNGNSLFLKGEADQIAAAQEDALEWLGPAVHEISEYWCARANRTQPGKIDPFRKIGRNEPCPCGSGKKYKKCCLGETERESW